MNRSQLIALVGVLALAALVLFLAVRARQPPVLPANPDHQRFVNPNACLSCHGPGGELPQSKNHTPRTDCMGCHGIP